MVVTHPPTIRLPCYNTKCTEQILFRLDEGYYKQRYYQGVCNSCGIETRINKFSPFITDILSTMENPTTIKSFGKKPVQRDNPNLL